MNKFLSLKLLKLIVIITFGLISTQIQAADTNSAKSSELINKLQALSGNNIRLSYQKGTSKVSFLTLSQGATLQQPFNGISSSDPVEVAESFLTEYQELFGEKYKAEYSLISNNTNNNRHSVKLRQTYRGIPVFAGEMVVRMNDLLDVTGANGEVSSNLNLSVTPIITAAEARQAAITLINKHHTNSVFNNLNTTSNKPALWIYNPSLISKGQDVNKLVWKMEVTAQQGEIKEFVMIDAHTGAVALHYSLIMSAKNREIYDNENISARTLPGLAVVRAEGDAAHAVQDVNDAYDYSGDTYDFYFVNHGRDSLNNAGMTLTSTVRHCDPNFGCPMQNAFWNGAQMAYGEGFAVDDVVAHELTHAVTQFTSNLTYLNESGAINESFSDVWGEFIDLGNGAGNDSAGVRWQLGEDIPGGIGAIRNLQDPTLFNDPDKISSPNYYCGSADNGGVHTNSGVNNKAAYLMADGDTFNGVTVAGIGIIKTAKVYYEAQTNILTSGATYSNLHDALITACNTLVGTDGITTADCSSVSDAVTAVEMNVQPCVMAPTPVCPVGTTPNDLLTDGFESGLGAWTHLADQGIDVWSLGTTNPQAGSNHIHGDNISSISDSHIKSNTAVALPANAYLRFDHFYDFESSYDGGVIEYSTDDGASWNDGGSVILENGYTGTIETGFSNPLAGRAAFVSDTSGNYISTRADLSTLAGQNVKFRFRIGTDGSVSNPGWDIDNLRVYTCDVLAAGPVITSPTPSSTLTGSSETFTWDYNGSAVEQWALMVGSTIGGSEYFIAGAIDNATSTIANGLPTDGSIIYVRLWYRVGTTWDSIDTTYTAATLSTQPPEIVTPTAGATLTASNEVFIWNYNGGAVEQWALMAGSTVGGSEYFITGAIDNATTTVANGLPTDGSTIYVRLWYRIGTTWSSIDATYTAAIQAPVITTPVVGATLTASSEIFTWEYNGSAVEQWALMAGSTPGGSEYFVGGAIDNATTTVAIGLPTDGSIIYVRLWYRVGATWSSIDATYTAATQSPVITSPIAGATLTTSNEVFAWDYNGGAVEQWALMAGSTIGGSEYFIAGAIDNATSTVVNGLPTDGSIIYVRLWYRIGTTWDSIDATYTATTISP